MAGMVDLTARQSVLIFGWWNPRRKLVWSDVLKVKLTLDKLISIGLQAPDLMLMQPDPVEWVKHTGASLKHARFMQAWGANPFVHFNADLADVLSMKPTCVEMVRMNINHEQLVEKGMNELTEKMFKFDEEEWGMLGKK